MFEPKNNCSDRKDEKAIRSIPDKQLYGLFFCAAVKGDLRIIKECIHRNIDVKYDNQTAMRLSSQKGFLDIVQCLIEHGCDLNIAKIYGTKEIKEWATHYEGKNNTIKIIPENIGLNFTENNNELQIEPETTIQSSSLKWRKII